MDALQHPGHAAAAPDLRPAVSEPRHAPAWVSQAAAAVPTDAGNVVLVAHSGAGRLVAGVRAADVSGIVLVDAGLPGEPNHRAGAPPEFDELIAGLAGEDGVLPPWPEWWPPGALDTLVPDADRRRLLDDAPSVPVALFDEPLPADCADVAPGVRVPYLAYGDGYAKEAAEAARRGWPVERIDGMHLHHLVDPDGVAAAIVRLANAAGP